MTVAGIDVVDVTTNPVSAAIFIVVIAAIAFTLLHLVVMVTVKPVPEVESTYLVACGVCQCPAHCPDCAVTEDEPVVLEKPKKTVNRSRSISKRSAAVLSSIKSEVATALAPESPSPSAQSDSESEEEEPKSTPRRRAAAKSASRSSSKSKAVAKSPSRAKSTSKKAAAKSPAKSTPAKSPARAKSTTKKSPGM